MVKVLLHDQRYQIGGPKKVLDVIQNSFLSKNFCFIRLPQEEACGYNIFNAIKFIIHYKREISKYNADVIYICGLQYIGLLMVIAAKLSNVKKIVLSVHGSEWDRKNRSLRNRLLRYIIEPLEVRLSDAIFTVCENAQNQIKALKFAKKNHNKGVVYNTFPKDELSNINHINIRQEYNIGDDKIIVVSVGRVVEDKGHRYLIESIKKINDKDFVFVIVGDGPYLSEYEKTCQNEINKGQVILTGKRDDVYDILNECDIFLFPTLHENHSIALMEAVKMNCVSIVSNVGGNPEVIQNEISGIVVPPFDSDSIVNALHKLKDENLRKVYSEMAYKYCVQKFSEENTLGKLYKILSNE